MVSYKSNQGLAVTLSTGTLKRLHHNSKSERMFVIVNRLSWSSSFLNTAA
uniref:Uncharacterized protein n=1 Tax=Aegilops tauschii subsp. strangulata TaxID=200361 RepID=A0A453EKK7_AEGTS